MHSAMGIFAVKSNNSDNPQELHQYPLHDPNVTFWCAMSSIGMIGTHFFEEGDVTVTVNSDDYCDVLEKI